MGKRQTLTLSQPKTPEPIVAKFEWRNCGVDPYHQKLGLIRTRVFASHIGKIFTPPYAFDRNPISFVGPHHSFDSSPL